MSTTNEDRAQRWLDINLGRTDRDLAPNGSVFYLPGEWTRLYSFGTHFVLAEFMRDSHGQPWILLNGDRYSHTTSEHQGQVRGLVANQFFGQTMIVPFSALSAAGIKRTTIEPLEVREDRFEEALRLVEPTGSLYDSHNPNFRSLHPDTPIMARWGYAGDRIFTGPVHTRQSGFIAPQDGWYILERQHFLGDSIFRARTAGERTRKRFLSSFDYNERFPLYFLCELPRSSKAETVAQGFEGLKPQAVKDAERADLPVKRQGDVFAIPTELTTRQMKMLTPHGKGRIVKRPKRGLIGTNHTATEVIFATEGRVYARGCLYHEPGPWRPPDHARRKLGDGKTWHLLIKNTVPQAKAPRQRTRERGMA